MPFPFYQDPVVDRPHVASNFYGPVLLAAEESGLRTDWRPVILAPSDIGKSITCDPATLRFSVGGIVFKPFYVRSLISPLPIFGICIPSSWDRGMKG